MLVIGAGLSGAIAGALDRQAIVWEAAAAPPVANHRAVLRFRSPKIGEALNIPFRPVRVTKAVEGEDGCLTTIVTPRLANLYARKVTGRITERSIGDLSPVERWVAPFDFHQQLLALVDDRVLYNQQFESQHALSRALPIVSTIPLTRLCPILGIKPPPLRFAPISVTRYDVRDCDAFQTVYHPAEDTLLYRSTLTGSLLIAEAMGPSSDDDVERMARCFGLDPNSITQRDTGSQTFGKITPLDAPARKSLLHRITVDFGIYSLGRFATWRNVLLDDVYEDFFKIRQMMALDAYDQKRAASQ